MSELQGVRLSDVKQWSGVSQSVIGHAIGNSMSRNVLDRLLPRVLHAAGLLPSLPTDRWQQGDLAAGL
jgi:hypothetical protein